MQKTKIPFILNVILFLGTLFLSLITDWNPSRWKDFNDPADYLQQSKIPLNSREFYAPHQQGVFFPRAFTVPLFFKMAGSNPEVIIQMQKFIHSLTTLFLAYAFLLIINRMWIRYLMLFSVYLLMSWWNILGWASQLLSESLSISLLFCWIASFILVWKKKNLLFILFHILVTIFFSFSRDTWPYIIILFYFLISVFTVFSRRSFFPKAFFLLTCSVILFFVQLNTSRVGHRHRLPLMNTIAVRILTNPDYTAWFEVRGMPDVKILHPKYRRVDITLDSDRHKIWNIYWNKDYNAFSDWTENEGRQVYMKFLLSHSSYFFLFHETKQQLQRIFAYNLWYTPEIRGYSRLTESLFPLFGRVSVSLFCVLLIILFFRKRDPILLFPVLLWLIFFANIFLSYNADALEVERHLFITMIAIQLIGFISLALILDHVNTQSPSPSWKASSMRSSVLGTK
jgi:hypothetical protein